MFDFLAVNVISEEQENRPLAHRRTVPWIISFFDKI